MKSTAIPPLLLVIAILVLMGCSQSAPNRVVVEGQVSYNGEPVANGQIYFYPKEENPGPVSGGPIKDGQYVAQARGGVPLGKHRVEITGFRPMKNTGAPVGEGLPAEQYLPSQFNQRSELTALVEPAPNPKSLDFDLKSRGQ
jgi:hypothetical protein